MKGRRTPVGFGVLLVLSAVYFSAGKLGLMLAFAHANATAVWPPTGIALAAFLLLGDRVRPAIFLQAFMAATAVSGLFFAAVLHQNRRVQEKRERVVRKLQSAIDQILTLRGLVPICAGCKKIRNHEGVWEQLEVYIENRSEARFTHGICPECSGLFR